MYTEERLPLEYPITDIIKIYLKRTLIYLSIVIGLISLLFIGLSIRYIFISVDKYNIILIIVIIMILFMLIIDYRLYKYRKMAYEYHDLYLRRIKFEMRESFAEHLCQSLQDPSFRKLKDKIDAIRQFDLHELEIKRHELLSILDEMKQMVGYIKMHKEISSNIVYELSEYHKMNEMILEETREMVKLNKLFLEEIHKQLIKLKDKNIT